MRKNLQEPFLRAFKCQDYLEQKLLTLHSSNLLKQTTPKEYAKDSLEQYLEQIGGLLGTTVPPMPPTGPADNQAQPRQGLVKQVLITPASATGEISPRNQARTGRSPHRRPLPPRGGAGDYDTTQRNSSSQSSRPSRTPDRAAKAPRQASPRTSLHGAAPPPLSPTLPMTPLHPGADNKAGRLRLVAPVRASTASCSL